MLQTLRENSSALKDSWHKVAKRVIPPVSAREAICALLQRQVGRGYPGRRTRGVWGRFRGIFVRVCPFENGTMIKGGTPKGAPPTHKAPQRGAFSAFGQGTHFQETQKFR